MAEILEENDDFSSRRVKIDNYISEANNLLSKIKHYKNLENSLIKK